MKLQPMKLHTFPVAHLQCIGGKLMTMCKQCADEPCECLRVSFNLELVSGTVRPR